MRGSASSANATAKAPTEKALFFASDGLRTQAPPNTGAGWYTLATGAWPGVHGSTNNTFHINGQPFGNSTSAFAPNVLQVESIAQSAERDGLKVAQVEWASRAPTIDFRSFLSGRGVATHFIGTAGGALFDDAAFISSFGLQFDHPAGYAGQAPFPGAAPVAATGWTGDLPETFSPAQEMRLRVLDFGVDKYGLNAWIFDSTDDSTTNYDKVLFSKTKDAADSVGTLAKGEWADVQVIGTQVNDITRAPTRLIESEMGNMVTDAMRTKYPGVEAAFTNSGGLRQDLLFAPPSAGEAPGEITWGEVFAVLPFGNRTTILTLTGDQLRAAFINGFTPFCQPGFPGGTGRFAQVSGLNVQFHCDGIVPVVDNMWKATDGVGGTLTPIGPADSLRIVTNDFMFGGGDGYTMFAGGTDVAQPGDDLLQVTIDYITAKRSNAAGLIRCDGNGAEVPSAVACPTPNLGSGAHATGISGAKGAQPSGRFGSTPSGRARGSVSLSAAA